MKAAHPGSGSLEQIVDAMSVPEKIGQMTQASNESISPAEVADFSIGSVLSGGNGNPEPNSPSAWMDMVGAFTEAAGESRLGVPLLYGVDAVHGHSNVRGATIFPHNIGLGSAGDKELVERIADATATEMLATGVTWAFAPTLAVPQDIRWGRTYEGYGCDADLVSRLGAASVSGLQGDGSRDPVLACPKHFVGDGATFWGTAQPIEWEPWWNDWGATWQIDQGDARVTEGDLRSVHLPPYAAAVAAGAMTVMASYSSWNGEKLHAHHGLLTEVLKGEMGFSGFVVSDWMGIDQIDPDYDASVVTAINAGIDMVMVPDDYERFISAMRRATSSGEIPLSRIDDAVRRILRAKQAAGLTDQTGERPPLSVVGSAEHRSLAQEAVRRSAVLLKDNSVLPLRPGGQTIEVAGQAADDIGLQCGGWTVGWQGGRGQITSGTTLLDGLRSSGRYYTSFDPSGRFPEGVPGGIGIVCVAEHPYAEGLGDSAAPTLSAEDHEVFARMRERKEVVVLVIYSGRPLVIPEMIEQADAVVAAWLPGTEGAALEGLLSGLHPFSAKTPQPWPRAVGDLGDHQAAPLFPTGHGIAGDRASIPT